MTVTYNLLNQKQLKIKENCENNNGNWRINSLYDYVFKNHKKFTRNVKIHFDWNWNKKDKLARTWIKKMKNAWTKENYIWKIKNLNYEIVSLNICCLHNFLVMTIVVPSFFCLFSCILSGKQLLKSPLSHYFGTCKLGSSLVNR